MKTIENLRNLFDSELSQELINLEDQRKNLIKRFIISGAILLVGILFLVVGATTGILLLNVSGVIIIILFLWSLWLNSKRVKTYKSVFKNNVVRKIVKFIDPEWSYDPTSSISRSSYEQSGLFKKRVDRYRGDDLVSGVIEKTDFQLSELHTEHKSVSTDSNGKRKETWQTIFKGLFAHAEFNKHISGSTYVLPDFAEKLFGKWGQKLQKNRSRGELVKLENQEFEKNFVVYSDDQIEARYILTPAMMESIVEIKKKFDKNIFISFVGSRVYIAISINKNLFEPRIFKSGVRFEDIEQMHGYFNTISVIVSEMNLNTRIWTKD